MSGASHSQRPRSYRACRRLIASLPMLLPTFWTAPAAHAAAVQKTWPNPVAGDWEDSSKWSPTGVPANGSPAGTTYNVLFNAPGGSPYTVTYGSSRTVDSVVLNSLNLTLRNTGTLTTQTLDLKAGKFLLDYALGNATITASGGSLVPGLHPLIDGVTFASDLDHVGEVTIYNNLTLANNVTLGLEGPSTGRFAFASTEQIAGNGIIVFNSGPQRPYLEVYYGTDTLTVTAGITLRTGTGGGGIGGLLPDGGTIVNHGTFSSAQPGLGFTIAGLTFINDGVLEAKNGGILELRGKTTNLGTITLSDTATLELALSQTFGGIGTVNRINGGGTISVTGSYDLQNHTIGPDGPYTLVGGTVAAGTLSDGGTGVSRFTVLNPGVTRPNFIAGCTIASDILLSGQGTTLQINNDTLANRNLILTTSSQILIAFGTQTLTGNGDIVVNGGNGTLSTRNPNNLGQVFTFILGSGITARTAGGNLTLTGNFINAGVVSSQTSAKTISLSPNFSFANQALLEAANGGIVSSATNLSNSGTLLAHSAGVVNVIGPFTNGPTGAVHATGGGSITLSGTLANVSTQAAGKTLSGGFWIVDANSTLSIPSTALDDNAASVTLNGPASTFDAVNSIKQNDGQFTVAAGRDFATPGPLLNNGTLAAGVGSDLATGADLTQSSAATLSVELLRALTQEDYGQFSINGIASLNGRLLITAAPGATVMPGDSFVILTASSISGRFSTVELPPAWNGSLVYEPNDVLLQITDLPEPAAPGFVLGLGSLLLGRVRKRLL